MSNEHLIDWPMLNWFANQGLPRQTLFRMVTLRVVHGTRAADGCLEEDPDGHAFLAFREQSTEDVVFWCPRTGDLATLYGRAFALGEDNITDATTYQFDNHLRIHGDPMSWLMDDGRGAVVFDWTRAFDRLRDAPRIAVSERLLSTYRDAMKPRHLPELSVIASFQRIAA